MNVDLLTDDLKKKRASATRILSPERRRRCVPGDLGHITAKHAAAVLRNLAKTGRVDWTVTKFTVVVEGFVGDLGASPQLEFLGRMT